MWKFLAAPTLITFVALIAVFLWGGVAALWLTIVLLVLETSLSFDNAVVNAAVLEKMSPVWRRRFLTWGILIAVFGARLVFPLLIVAAAAHLSPLYVGWLVFFDPSEYGRLIEAAAPVIHSFGGAFLLLVALKYFLDTEKETHWVPYVERRLAVWGRVEAIGVAITLGVLLLAAQLSPAHAAQILAAGIAGIILFVALEGLVGALETSSKAIAGGGFAMFMYLELLDAAFSLDGVIGAFALTTQLVIIFVGLGLGALFVRSFTLLLVERKTLANLTYLEHGAYWAIFSLAFYMFAMLVAHVPEAVAGIASVFFLGAAYISSLRVRPK